MHIHAKRCPRFLTAQKPCVQVPHSGTSFLEAYFAISCYETKHTPHFRATNSKISNPSPTSKLPSYPVPSRASSNRVWAARRRLQFTEVPKWSVAHVTTKHICFVPRGQRTLTRQFHGCNRFWRCKLRYPALTSSFQRKPSLRSLLFRPLCSRFSQHSVVTASGTLWLHPRSTRALPVSLSNRGRRKPELAQPPYLLARVMPYFLPILKRFYFLARSNKRENAKVFFLSMRDCSLLL